MAGTKQVPDSLVAILGIVQAVRAAVVLMSALMREWLESLEGHEPNGHEEPRCDLAVARLEGIGLCFMCSPDVSIRRAAWDLLAAVRQLSMALSASSASGKPQVQVLHACFD